MPLAVRYVEPKHLYRQPLPRGIKNELQAVAAYSLCGVIRQLGSLAKHAESLIGELCEIMKDTTEREKLLEERLENLKRKVIPQLDMESEVERNMEVVLDAEHFQSKSHISQQLLSIATAPDSLIEQYQASHPKPAFHLFAKHSETNPMHLYSQPEFFFNHWRSEMEKKALSTNRRRITSTGDTGMFEESVEVSQMLPPPTKQNKRSSKVIAPPTSYSSTLPLRIKPRRGNKTKLEMMEAFSSVKKMKNKERATISKDTFIQQDTNKSKTLSCTSETKGGGRGEKANVTGASTNNSQQDQSESSGYMSQHSSSSTSLVEAEQGEGSAKMSTTNQPLVLSRTKSSSSLKGGSPKRGVATSEAGGSPRRVSINVSPVRKGSGQSSATPFISPKASPEIVHKTVNLVRSLSQTSPLHEKAFIQEDGSMLCQPSSGIFNFPDPIQFLISNQHLNATNNSFSLEDILSIDDDDNPSQAPPPKDTPTQLPNVSSVSSLKAPPTESPVSRRSFSSNESPRAARKLRPAPSPPIGATPTRRHYSMSNGYSPRRKESGDNMSRDSSVEASPTLSRKSQINVSPVPRRKAPPPPLLAKTPSNLDRQSPKHIDRVRSFSYMEGGARSQVPRPQTRKMSHEVLHNNSPPPPRKSPSSPKKSPPSNVAQVQDGHHGNRRGSESKGRNHGNPPTAKKEDKHDAATKERRHSNIVTTPPAAINKVQSPTTPKPGVGSHGNKLILCIKRQSSADKLGSKKSTNQILRASGIETVITTERSNFLSSIRKGIQLKKVQQRQLEEKIPSDLMPWDVAAILERRKALEGSDNELDDGLVQDAEWEEI